MIPRVSRFSFLGQQLPHDSRLFFRRATRLPRRERAAGDGEPLGVRVGVSTSHARTEAVHLNHILYYSTGLQYNSYRYTV